MARNDNAPQTIELERQSRGRDATGKLGRLRLVPIDREAARLQRRARRQALALMAASAVASLLILSGLWLVLRSVIAG